MKQPSEADFEVRMSDAGVVATFKPTRSIYSFYRLADPDDIKRHGPILSEPDSIRHAGPTGDTGDYPSHEVQRMAYRLVAEAAALTGEAAFRRVLKPEKLLSYRSPLG
jgi:hypothetical protein